MAASDLVQLAEVKTWLNIPSGITTDDTLLSSLISQMSEWVDNYCGRNLFSTTYQEIRDGLGGVRIHFRQWPVTAVASLYVDGVSIPASTGYLTGPPTPGFIFTDKFLTLVGGYSFGRGKANVVVNFTAGYSIIPNELVWAAKQLIALRYRNRNFVGKTSQNLGGQSSNYFTSDEATPDVLRVLDSYRRFVP